MGRIVSSKHLEGVSDLTLSAPILSGFIDAFDNVTYETRLRLTLEALFKLRSTIREHSLVKPFVDTADRIQSLLAFRLAVLTDPDPHRLLLSATFDRPFEPYMRLIWDPLGPLLDLIFCNCEDYKPAVEHDFPDYLQWVRSSQIDSGFFYSTSGASVVDGQYLLQIERLQRECAGAEAAAVGMIASDPEAMAAQVRRDYPLESNQLAIEALVALYRLADLYPPDQMDKHGKYLLRAVRGLLRGWQPELLPEVVRDSIAEQLAWYATATPEPRRETRDPPFDPSAIQGGIFSGGENGDGARGERPVMTHGCLLLMRIDDPAKARTFLGGLVIPSDDERDATELTTVAFTCHGLAAIGVAEAELAVLPQEFREGMEARAGLLGDIRESHPRRWRLPPRNWPGGAVGAAAAPVEMAEIDIVIQLRTRSGYFGHEVLGDPDHPLHSRVDALAAAALASGVQLLSVQSMRRAVAEANGGGRGHFGFLDGLSQPSIGPGSGAPPRDQVARGEILLGYANDRRDPPAQSPLLRDGTFLVVRKLRQDIGGFERFLTAQCARQPDITRDDLATKLMGRSMDGHPPLPGTSAASNDFDYQADPKGTACPFQAHVRRVNPRPPAGQRKAPRILRRGMSYGPPMGVPAAAERGLMFMAYGASIAEQYEVIQRWLNGGNSTGVYSAHGDPIMATAASPEDPRTFRFHLNGNVVRVDIPRPFVQLEWGVYLFVPSLPALRRMAEGEPSSAPACELPADRGERLIDGIAHLSPARQALAWKTWLEDFAAKDPADRDEAAAVWAAIREKRGGVLKVPYGDGRDPPGDIVLVASPGLVETVFTDDSRYAMSGPAARMRQSFGMIYLGLDSSPAYDAASEPTNTILRGVGQEDAFHVAYGYAAGRLKRILSDTARLTGEAVAELELRQDFITPVLADICRVWFGIPEREGQGVDPRFAAGGWSWKPVEQRKPRCPGDFIAPSRYCFYPDPGESVSDYGRRQGKALHAAAVLHFEDRRAGSGQPPAPVADAISAAIPDTDELARTVIGVMIGFLPPADGNLRGVLYEWLSTRALWRVQRTLTAGAPGDHANAVAALLQPMMRAMQKRPAPDMVWRSATTAHRLGEVDVAAGDRLAIGIVSATAALAAAGDDSVFPVFGGDRWATPHPPHACPAYHFAIGTMLGMLSALLEAGRIEEMPAPLIIRLSAL